MSSPDPSPSALGYDDGPWPALLADLAPPDRSTHRPCPCCEGGSNGRGVLRRHGRVLRADRGAITVATPRGVERVELTHRDPHVVTGDWVALPADDRPGLAGVAPRTTAIARPSHHRGFRTGDAGDQVLAANVDLVGVAVPLADDLNVRRLERGVVLAYEAGATPVVVLTKADLCPPEDRDHALARAREAGPGLDVIPTSAVTGEGIDELRALLRPARTLALLGSSGAGKSTVTNALVGEDVMETQSIRTVDGKGRHTTTHRELVAVPGGGCVLDTPGLRTLSVGQVGDGLDRAFADIEALAEGCRFRDCRHDGEPGCEIAAALDDGRLPADRFEGFRRIRAESESAALRADVAAHRKAARETNQVYAEAMNLRRRVRGER